jgi:diguanylate cyclase (GGDEF)-like protein
LTSFRIKLVIYFALLALVPLGTAFVAFSIVLRNGETARIDAQLEGGLRAALRAYEADVRSAAAQAAEVAADTRVQRALVLRDRAALASLEQALGVRIVVGRSEPRRAPATLEVRRSASVVDGGRLLGAVVVSLRLDERLPSLQVRSALPAHDALAVIRDGRVVAGPAMLVGEPAPVEPGVPGLIGRDDEGRYRALASGQLPEPPGAELAALVPDALVAAAGANAHQRSVYGLIGASVLNAIVAWILGRSIVRYLRELASGADAIASGRLEKRVPVRGRDEFAELARTFNTMATQLEARVDELEAERSRLRETTVRVAEALGATHDAEQLRRVIVETAVEATGAVGGMLEADEGTIVVGDPEVGRERLELELEGDSTRFGRLVLHGERFGEEQHAVAALLAGQAVVALENARQHALVQRQASLDPLTGLANRRRGEELLRKELARAERLGSPFALVLADLDDFKAINDRHGHPAGDRVLQEFAAAVRGTVRQIDHAARFGGEEFALLLPGTDRDGASRVAERVRESLEQRVIMTDSGEQIRVTASFGVAIFPAAPTRESLVAAADAALYEAKRHGKNRVKSAAARPAAQLAS